MPRADSRPAAERLRELQRLRDDDLISDDEFEAQRARILDEAFGPGQTEMASGSGADGPRRIGRGSAQRSGRVGIRPAGTPAETGPSG